MNVFEEFLRELFNGEPMIREANICGRSVIGKVDDQIIVKIVLVSTERSKAIDAILCTVLNRYGVIDKQMYLFSEMIRSSPVLRESDGEDGFEEKFVSAKYWYEKSTSALQTAPRSRLEGAFFLRIFAP